MPVIMDAVAPALLVAQGIGRVGNYFNKELFGGPTDLSGTWPRCGAVAPRSGSEASLRVSLSTPSGGGPGEGGGSSLMRVPGV